MEYILFKTTSGIEVIGKVIQRNDDKIVISYPLVIQIIPQQNGHYGVGFVPYSPVDPDGDHEFYLQNIQSKSVKVPSELEKGYIQQTSSIQIVGA